MGESPQFEGAISDGVLQVASPGARWLSTGWDGGVMTADATYNVTVPEGFDETEVGEYARERREEAGFFAQGPALLTGVSQEHARCARLDSVAVYATVGLSNPAVLPMAPDGDGGEPGPTDTPPEPGTVNLIVGTDRALGEAALANLVATVAEAKTATLLAETGFTGTTSDAIVVGTRPDGEPAQFSGSATPVGAAARACVRDAIQASLASRYPDEGYAASVEAARYGSKTDRRATMEELSRTDTATQTDHDA